MGSLQMKYLFTIDDIERCLATEKKVMIYGAGDHGRRICDYIISIGKIDQVACFLVTEKRETDRAYQGVQVQAAGYLSHAEHLVVIAVSQPYQEEIVEVVRRYGNRYCCMTRALYDGIGRALRRDPRKRVRYDGLDFMLAGFSKCGTTSLHKALMQIRDIYLSEKKESAFFRWYDKVDAPMERLAEDYFGDIRQGQLVGMIEPDFSTQAEGIRHFFGGELKLIFCVRDPVNAVFSRFKMDTRLGLMEMREVYQRNGGVFGDDVFDMYFDRNDRDTTFVRLGRYADLIEQFLAYYPREQIKIVVFEEMIKNPQRAMNDILCFVGSSCQYESRTLPTENEGNFVMADIQGLDAARRRLDAYWQHKYPEEIRRMPRDASYEEQLEAERQFRLSEKIYDVRLKERQRKMLQEYYHDSVRKLGKMMGRDLTKIWS